MKLFKIAACFVPFSLALAQSASGAPAFEVTSIKPSDPGSMNATLVTMNADAGTVRYGNISLKSCIRAAYGVRDFQIQGPAWMDDARFEIIAKLPPRSTTDQIPEMMQALLAERFKLTLRRDSTEHSVYALIAAKSGLKLKAAEMKGSDGNLQSLGPDGRPRPIMMFRFLPGSAYVTAPSATLASSAELMSRFTERPVVDMTGIAGQYNFELTFAPETTRGLQTDGVYNPGDAQTSSDPAPAVFDAVKKYGLNLEPRRALLEILTVTHMEKTPTEN